MALLMLVAGSFVFVIVLFILVIIIGIFCELRYCLKCHLLHVSSALKEASARDHQWEACSILCRFMLGYTGLS